MLVLSDELSKLKNMCESKVKLYAKLGIYTINDLLWHIPRGYMDFTSPVKIKDAKIDELIAVRGKVIDKQWSQKRNLIIYTVLITDGEDELQVKIFNAKQMFHALAFGAEFIFWGKITRVFDAQIMQLRSFARVAPGLTMRPIYGMTAGLASWMIAVNVREVLTRITDLPGFVPPEMAIERGLLELKPAFATIHFPANRELLADARSRLMLEELIDFNLGILKLRAGRCRESLVCVQDCDLTAFYGAVGFKLTLAQERTIEEVVLNIKGGQIVSRLVQGDVGCGKTVVAAAIIYLLCKNGYQAAIMAPTEMLAAQHYNNLAGLFSRLGVTVALLSGGVAVGQKKKILERLAVGEIHCVVGTSALLAEAVEFARLGLVVTDEQHKFGVNQRKKLGEKGMEPHTLIMSATPIPRTLAMMLYGDLDISVINELPPGRLPVKSCFVDSSRRQQVYAFIKKELNKKHQVYIVCPLVEEDGDSDGELVDDDGLKKVVSQAEQLQSSIFKEFKIGFVHGRMRRTEKNKVMQDFKENRIHILVSTTVIEVGIDIPNATVILIENAERFGLAQLHQLRGRIGRSNLQSYCILLSDSRSELIQKRLAFVAAHPNGFEIAEFDLKTRGPGEFLGTRQHGAMRFKIADPYDLELLSLARNIAQKCF
ncbi:MAG: ATP-dependent DNA helicase RecG [Oscillospiraceae bacterium]|jgi:ATP-dependent DNA helicase RecG|nr:ATP-dependent DNA helicase RecG [Oscillospiraceae bacterium]